MNPEILDQAPPHSTDLEQQLLGSILMDPYKLDVVAPMLRPDDFYHDAHRRLYGHFIAMRNGGGGAIDTTLLYERLVQTGDLKAVGGSEYILRTVQSVAVPHHAEHYARIVAEKAVLRQLRRTAEQVIRDVQKEQTPAGTLARRVRADLERVAEATAGEQSKSFRIDTVNLAEVDADGAEATMLVRGMLAEGELGFMGAARKGLKTSFAWDLGISLATGRPFLGTFEVSECRNVLYLSGEGSRPFLRNLNRRICEAKGVHPSDVSGFRLATAFPRLDQAEHLTALRRVSEEIEAAVWIYDCVYLGLSGTDASNSLAMGEKLRAVIELAEKIGVTPILLHHTTRRQQHEFAGQAPELTDLSWAGFAEAAAQWFMIGRRAKYDPATPGSHQLVFEFGGRHGQSGSFAVDVEEGDIEAGRYWQVDVRPIAEAREAARDAKQAARDAGREVKRQEEAETDKTAVVRVMVKQKSPLTKTELRGRVPFGHARFDKAFSSLADDGTIRPSEVSKGNNRSYQAWELTPTE